MDLESMFVRFLEQLINQGFEPPIYALTVGSNGHIMAGQYVVSPTGECLDFIELTSYSPQEGKVGLPINIILIDTNGLAARCLISEPDQEPDLRILN